LLKLTTDKQKILLLFHCSLAVIHASLHDINIKTTNSKQLNIINIWILRAFCFCL